MGIKVKLTVQLWIPNWSETGEIFVGMRRELPLGDDYMPLDTDLEVELPVEMPTKEEVQAYRKKAEIRALQEQKARHKRELERIRQELRNSAKDAYEITDQGMLEGD